MHFAIVILALNNYGVLVQEHVCCLVLQMIVERLYVEKDMNVQTAAVESPHKFSVVEENAIYYVAGYVVRKLLKKQRRSQTQASTNFALPSAIFTKNTHIVHIAIYYIVS